MTMVDELKSNFIGHRHPFVQASLSTDKFAVHNIDMFESKYRCLACKNLLRNPVQLECGHRICQTCVHPQNDYIQCLECQSMTLAAEIRVDKGFLRDMQTLDIICGLCQWSGKFKNYQDHLEQSHKQFECEYCSEIFDSITLVKEHKMKSCSKMLITCSLQQYECKDQFLRGDRESHYQSEQHQKSVIDCFEQVSSQCLGQSHRIVTAQDTTTMETSGPPYKVVGTSTTAETTEKLNDDLTNMHRVIDILSDGVHSLNDELISLNNESLEQSQLLERSDTVLSTIKTSIEETNDCLTAMNTNVSILHQDLLILKQKYEDMQVTSDDGTLVWKIAQFNDKMTDAKSDRQVSLYSPPFRSSPTGYKMRARLYLYGDGNARRTHMSLFFVIMRGQHDSLLTFPFSYKVTFCLYDQTSARRHIIDSFRPDTKSNSFQRPRSDMNIASGIPKFVSLSILEKLDNPYVKNDTMFIKVMVDFENMPKAILPYALTLNPGMPTHAQQKLIRREMEQRPQQSQSTTQLISAGGETKKK